MSPFFLNTLFTWLLDITLFVVLVLFLLLLPQCSLLSEIFAGASTSSDLQLWCQCSDPFLISMPFQVISSSLMAFRFHLQPRPPPELQLPTWHIYFDIWQTCKLLMPPPLAYPPTYSPHSLPISVKVGSIIPVDQAPNLAWHFFFHAMNISANPEGSIFKVYPGPDHFSTSLVQATISNFQHC